MTRLDPRIADLMGLRPEMSGDELVSAVAAVLGLPVPASPECRGVLERYPWAVEIELLHAPDNMRDRAGLAHAIVMLATEPLMGQQWVPVGRSSARTTSATR